jgi:hypothetical protein
MIGGNIEGNARVSIHAMCLQHDSGRQLQRTVAPKARALLLDGHMRAHRSVEVSRYVAIQSTLDMMS